VASWVPSTRKNYAVKASIPAGHANDFRAFFAGAPKAEEHEIGIAEGKVVRPGVPIVEDVPVQQGVQLKYGDVQVAGGFQLGIKLFRRLQWSRHSDPYPVSKRNAGELGSFIPSALVVESGKLPHSRVQ